MSMTLAEAVAILDKLPPIRDTEWGYAVIACREAARATLTAGLPVRKCRRCKKPMDQAGVLCVACEDFVDPDGRSN